MKPARKLTREEKREAAHAIEEAETLLHHLGHLEHPSTEDMNAGIAQLEALFATWPARGLIVPPDLVEVIKQMKDSLSAVTE